MKMYIVSILVAAAVVTTGLAADPLPKDWKPSVSAAREWLESDLENAPQQGMNLITGALAELADAELAIVYLRLHALLDSTEQTKLRNEQQRWFKLRDKAAADAVDSEGGSLAPTEANLGAAEFTKKRIAELQKRLARALAAGKERE